LCCEAGIGAQGAEDFGCVCRNPRPYQPFSGSRRSTKAGQIEAWPQMPIPIAWPINMRFCNRK
jgi:hypothetical protein